MVIINIQDTKNKKVLNSLRLFIEDMKCLSVDKSDNLWESDVWVINEQSIKFTKLSEKYYHNEKMNFDFISFAKAYIMHEYPSEPHRSVMLMPALRCIEYILVKTFNCGDICLLNKNILEELINVIKGRYSNNYACAINNELTKIISFLAMKKFTYKNISGWKGCVKDERYLSIHGFKNDNKLPREDVLYFFADIFSQELNDKRDIFTTSIIALLMSAPSRISEVLLLSIDCMFTAKTKKGEDKWGLRFWSGKGFGGGIKWIPGVMVPTAQKAIDRILNATTESRQFAKLMELDFKSFHRQTKFNNYNENKILTVVQICELLYNKVFSENECRKILKRLSLELNCYSLKNLWQELQNRLPKGFPWFDKSKNIKYSDLLFLFYKDTFHPNKSDDITQIYVPNKYLFQGNVISKKNNDNIFKRHGYCHKNETKNLFHSHQIRHLLNTIAQRNGMNEDELAKWSGRANIKQNRVYNHVTEEEIIQKYESLKLTATNYLVRDKITVRDPVSREVLLSINHGAIHKTEFGYCLHDYALSPCDKFRDCLNCSEQVCIKGNSDNLTRLKEKLADTNDLIGKTIKNTDKKDLQLDKDRWLAFHIKNSERLQELIKILEDKNVPDNSFVRLANKCYSHLSRVTSNKERLRHNKGDEHGKKNN